MMDAFPAPAVAGFHRTSGPCSSWSVGDVGVADGHLGCVHSLHVAQ